MFTFARDLEYRVTFNKRMTKKDEKASEKEATFEGLGISTKILEVLAKNKFVTPTPIQLKAIPVALEGTDVVGIAQTGTGKTLAFAIPMLQRVSRTNGQGLVLAPTRELALQAEETFNLLGKKAGIRTAVLIGGASMRPQLTAIKRKPHIIIATPGRINDHLDNGRLKLNRVNVFVLDEADRMWDMGFAPQVKQVMKYLPKDRQTLLFSATMPDDIAKIAKTFMKLPVSVEVARHGQVADNVEQELFVVDRKQKRSLLQHLLEDNEGTAIVFTRTKHGAKKVARMVRQMNIEAVEIHGNRTLAQRKAAIAGFKAGKYRVLVATDVVGRGIDITGVAMVINHDLPDQAEDYIHRIGRTGRAGLSGKAFSFATPDQGKEVNAIEKLMKTQIPITKTPSKLPASPPGDNSSHRERGNYGRSHSSRGRSNSQSKSRSNSKSSYSPKKSSPSKYGKSTAAPKKRDTARPTKPGTKKPRSKKKRGGFPPKKFYGGMGV